MTSEEEYQWNLILKASIPIAIVTGFAFYTNISNTWKYIILVASLILTGVIIYLKNKKKSNIFTGIAVVFLVTLIVRFLKASGII